MLDANRRYAEAEVAFYQALVQYNLSIIEVHFRKGSLLDYCGVVLQEGPWPAKAYFDALIRARQRDASYYFDYGYSRPHVISRGPTPDGAYGMLGGNAAATTAVSDAGQPTMAEPIESPAPADSPGLEETLPAPTEAVPAAPSESRSAMRFVEPSSDSRAQAAAGTTANRASHTEASAATSTDQKFNWNGLME